MTLTSITDSGSTTTAVVRVRIPSRTDGDLVTGATERLSRVEDVASVTVDELQGVEPQLSATVVAVGVTIQWTTGMADTDVRARLAAVTGIDVVDV